MPLFLFIILIIVLLMVVTASQNRRHGSFTDLRLCRSCGTAHPTFAQFCRKCGRRLL
jgi:ribosomal protein L40E